MERIFLKIAPYICVSVAIFLAVKQLLSAPKIWAYSETAFVLLAITVIFLLIRLINEIPE